MQRSDKLDVERFVRIIRGEVTHRDASGLDASQRLDLLAKAKRLDAAAADLLADLRAMRVKRNVKL